MAAMGTYERGLHFSTCRGGKKFWEVKKDLGQYEVGQMMPGSHKYDFELVWREKSAFGRHRALESQIFSGFFLESKVLFSESCSPLVEAYLASRETGTSE